MKIKSGFTLFITLAVVSQLLIAADSTDLSADDIMHRANLAAVYPGNDGRADARMLIVDSQGRKQMRQFIMLRKNLAAGGDQQYLVVFTRPADVERTGFLVYKHPLGDDDRWLYLPGLDLVKRIAAGDKRTSFVGSTFFYEDISGRSVEADHHELQKVEGGRYWIRNTPKAPETVEFSYYVVQIDATTFLPMQADYYDHQDRLYRSMEAQKVQTIDGFPTITSMKAMDVLNQSYTLTQMRNVAYNIGLTKQLFSERSLRNPPQKWLTTR